MGVRAEWPQRADEAGRRKRMKMIAFRERITRIYDGQESTMGEASAPVLDANYKRLRLRAESLLLERGRALDEVRRDHPTDPLEQAALELFRAKRSQRTQSLIVRPSGSYIVERSPETKAVTVRRGSQTWRTVNSEGMRSPEGIILRDAAGRNPTNEEIERLARALAGRVNLDSWLVTAHEARAALTKETA